MAPTPEPRPAPQAPESPERNPYAPPKSVAGALERRALPGLAMLAGALALERLTHFEARQLVSLKQLTELAWIFPASKVAALVVAGVVALRIGPRKTAVTGAAISAAGHLVLAFGAPVWLGGGVAGIGGGMVWPCVVAAGAESLVRRHDAGRAPAPHRVAALAAFALVLLAAIQVGSFASGSVLETMNALVGPGTMHVLDALLMALAAGLAARGARQERVLAESAAAAPERGLVGLAILVAPFLVVSVTPWTPAQDPSVEMLVAGGIGRILVAASGFALLLVAARGRRTPPLVLAGAALVASALGAALWALAGGASPALAALSIALSGADPVAEAVTTAYAAIAVRARAATLAVAAVLGLELLWNMGGTVAGTISKAPGWLIGICALIGLCGGAALAAYGRALHRRYFEVGT